MVYFVEVYCRLAIRLCVGYHANGREKYRTVNIRGVRRDVTTDQVAAFVRALAPLLEGRIVRVWLVRKDRVVMGEAPPARYAAGTPLVNEGGRAGGGGRIGDCRGPLAGEGADGHRLTEGAMWPPFVSLGNVQDLQRFPLDDT